MSLASREDWAAPVSIRAGNFTPDGRRMTSSTNPRVIFSFDSTGVPHIKQTMNTDMTTGSRLLLVLFLIREIIIIFFNSMYILFQCASMTHGYSF
jgi:hypothetical protein